MRSASLLAFGVLMAALLAACGGGSSTKTATATTVSPSPSTTAGANDFAAHTQCMAAHGVSNIGGRGNGTTSSTAIPAMTVDPSTMAAARAACASLRPAGGGGGGGGAGLNGPAAAAYRNCLQLHGVTVPTTAPGGGGGGGGGGGFGGAANQNDPAFQAAAQACASLRPVRPATTTTT